MPRIDLDAHDQRFVDELVASRLARAPGEYTLLSAAPGLARPIEPFEDYARRQTARAHARGAAIKTERKRPPDPTMLRIQSWQYGLTPANSDAEAIAVQDALFPRLQSYNDDTSPPRHGSVASPALITQSVGSPRA